MKNLRKLGVLMAAIFLLASCNEHNNTITKQPSVYEKVVKEGKITCGYIAYPPGCIKDPNTGKLSGVFVETLEKAAENLGLKVEWKEEVGWGTMIEGLQTNRYELIGSPVWANAARGKLADFTTPLFYSGIGIWVRANDNRFQNTLEGMNKINNNSVKISLIDGDMSDLITKNDFPNTTQISLPQNSENSQLFLNVANGKADVTFIEPSFAEKYMQNNPGKIKNIAADKPIRVFPNTMMLKKGEPDFQNMLNSAIAELINSGYVDKLIDKYDPKANLFYRVAKPYQAIK
jgi:ABC-type amino acid transport substrate-binding protein